ncbi:NIPSNAP family protein [Streptomyces cyaneofuscatus]
MTLVDTHGGTLHGYHLPAEGASDEALALFGFPGLAEYEKYRGLFAGHPDFIEPTASGTRAAAYSATNAPSCDRWTRTADSMAATARPGAGHERLSATTALSGEGDHTTRDSRGGRRTSYGGRQRSAGQRHMVAVLGRLPGLSP